LPIINDATELYKFYRKNNSKFIEEEIRKDLLRSDPNHEDFNSFDKPGCLALENVLKAYSNLDREIGYV